MRVSFFSGGRGYQSVGLYPAHKKGYHQQYEQCDRQHNANGQEFYGTIRLPAIFDQAEHAGTQADKY